MVTNPTVFPSETEHKKTRPYPNREGLVEMILLGCKTRW